MYYQTIELYLHMIIDLTNYFYRSHFFQIQENLLSFGNYNWFFACKCLVSGRKDILRYKIKEFVVRSKSRNLQQ
jgi:hypothetical protein